ncbi:hypothetical protein V2A26_29055 [Pseudomonas aeruginosa]
MDDLRPAGPAEYRWLLAVQERERRLLAQAVHDDIGPDRVKTLASSLL